jgi:L-alanine-DL-glutamate epimerase-like enolase superfamily enzyme
MKHDHAIRRRSFLKTASLAAFGAISLPDKGRADPSISPLRDLAKDVGRLKIKEVKAFPLRRAVFVRVKAEDGRTGWGEGGHSGGHLVAETVKRELATIAEGRDVFDADPVWSAMYFEADELGPSGLAAQAIAGVDCALWDLRGKVLGLPVWRLLGGKYRRQIPLYGSFSRDKGNGQFMTPAECAARANSLVEEGFRAIKVRLAIREENLDPADDPAFPVVREIRRAVGDTIELYVDANNGYSAKRAITVGKRLAESFGVALFEEPVAAFQYASLARVSQSLSIPVSAGEHEYTKWQMRDLILHGKIDVLNPDVSKLAGLTEAMKVSTLADVFDVPISVHNARPTLLTAAHLHFVAASRMATRTQEHPGSQRLADLWQFFHNKLVPKDGMLEVPDEPGFGLHVNEQAVEKGVQ